MHPITSWPWGCGAFGGNRTLMALVQVAAARLAGVARLVDRVVDRGYLWGETDGN